MFLGFFSEILQKQSGQNSEAINSTFTLIMDKLDVYTKKVDDWMAKYPTITGYGESFKRFKD